MSLMGVAALSTLITGWLKNKLNTNGTWSQVLSWAVAVGLGAFAKVFAFGMFTSMGWGWAIAYGVGAGLVSNGIFDLSFVQSILEILKAHSPTKKV